MLWFLYGVSIGIIVNTLTLKILTEQWFSDTFVVTGGLLGYFVGATVFSVVNTFVRPVLKIITVPVHFLTFGLSLLLLNGVILWLWEYGINAIAWRDISVSITGIWYYVLIGFIFSISNTIFHWFTIGRS